MRFLLILAIVWLSFPSCNKTSLTHLESYEQCNQKLQLDSSDIYNRLVGKWMGTIRECTTSSTLHQSRLDSDLEFKSNDSFYVSNSSGIITQGTWKLRNIVADTWGLNITTPSIYRQGRILFCSENGVVFDSTFVSGDGCASHYHKNP